MKRPWKLKPVDENQIHPLCLGCGCSPLFARLLLLRGFTGREEVDIFLSPSDYEIPDPFLFSEMKPAVDRILQALDRKERVLIHGDYDVDGITATAIMLETLNKIGLQAEYYLPDRLGEGYGLQAAAIPNMAEKYSLVITVDCGTTSYEAIDLARKHSLDVIVTDHHSPGDRRPDAVAVLNPIRPDEAYPSKCLSGAGVAWKLASALRSIVYKFHDADDQLELVALGMVADVVPLLGENRSLLIRAFERFKRLDRPGLTSLMDLSKVIPAQITTHCLGFQLGPRLNAAGRMDHPRHALDLLLTQEPNEGAALARHLNQLNQKRRQIEARLEEEIVQLVEQKELHRRHPKVMVIAGADWHRGILGILAQRMVQRYQKSVFLLSSEGELAYGSARTVEGADLIPLLDGARSQAVSCGGHAAAAGMKVRTDQIQRFEQALYDAADEHWRDVHEPPLWMDASLPLEQVNDDLMAELDRCKPFGKGNEEPVFFARALLNGSGPRIVGNNHLSLRLQHPRGSISAIGWSQGYKVEHLRSGEVELAFKCRYNEYQGRREINLNLVDIRSAVQSNNVINLPVKMTQPTLSRESLGRVYRLLTRAANEEKQIPHQHAFMLGQLEKITREDFDTALTIFQELGLLTVKDGKIQMLEATERRDLSLSPTFRKINEEK